jgi:hypothetical protein
MNNKSEVKSVLESCFGVYSDDDGLLFPIFNEDDIVNLVDSPHYGICLSHKLNELSISNNKLVTIFGEEYQILVTLNK